MKMTARWLGAILSMAVLQVNPAMSASAPRKPAGVQLRAEDQTWRAPKGYEKLRPATLYTFSDIPTMIWIVARDRIQAEELMATDKLNIGTQTSKMVWRNCLGMRNPDACPTPIVELGYGWMATLQATDNPADITFFYAYEAQSRQAAIDRVLTEYRKQQGNMTIQSLRVGLVSEIPWDTLLGDSSGFGSREGGLNPSEINYRTICDWSASGFNTDPDVFTGDTEASSACKNEYRPDEKLPVPVLVANPAKR